MNAEHAFSIVAKRGKGSAGRLTTAVSASIERLTRGRGLLGFGTHARPA
jgi:hypothetical protein